VFNYQIIDFQNQKYIVRRRIRETDLVPDFDNEALMEWTRTDRLLRKNGYIWCCELIADAEIIE
tara:strand:- start:57 stop:248 length:192 start_codon:yes stop_codon:yes gene_type:complete